MNRHILSQKKEFFGSNVVSRGPFHVEYSANCRSANSSLHLREDAFDLVRLMKTGKTVVDVRWFFPATPEGWRVGPTI